MSLKLPNDKIVYNLPEQVGVNAENIKYLAEVYKDIDSIPAQFAVMKTYFDDIMSPAFSTWTTTFEGWTNTLDTYLANMSSAAVGAIAGQDIAPRTVSQTNANASGTIPTFSGSASLTVTSLYTRYEEINRVLYLVYNMQITNNTGNSVTRSAGQRLFLQDNLYLPSSIADNVYDFENVAVSSSRASPCAITAFDAFAFTDKNAANNIPKRMTATLFNHTGARVVQAFFIMADEITIADGDSVYVTARAPLTLI